MTWRNWTVLTLVALAGLAIGRCSSSWWSAAEGSGSPGPTAEPGSEAAELWTCPMHPEIRMPEFGACPKCGMDLVQLTDDGTGPRQLALSAAAVALAQITTEPVRRQFVTKPVRMVGKVDFDETRVRSISARVAGRLERLYVDYAGISVQHQDHLVSLYSPDLLIAQQELIEARSRLTATAGEPSVFLQDSNRRGYESARSKLRLWGLTAEQIGEIEQRGTADDHILIRSPAAGVVIDKYRNEGDYVQEGTPIYRIADLSHLWIQLDAYEQDLPWLRYGQGVSLQAEALPGESFEGWISFLDPMVSDRTRTVRVRVDVDNPNGSLKPGMFVRGVVRARIGANAQVLEPRLAGKWISPMHPEIVKDGPGTCDVCGMALVPAESLGYVREDAAEKPLVVPTSAVLVTGTRAVVYVQVEGKERPTYEGREVVLGPRADDKWLVRSGLRENERVVVSGAFRVDSAMQIQAKPSMMSMPGEKDLFVGADTAAFRSSLTRTYDAYLQLQTALAADGFTDAMTATARLSQALQTTAAATLPRRARERWDAEHELLMQAVADAQASQDIAELRRHFEPLSHGLLAIERMFRHVGAATHIEAFCPMAFDDKGAAWLQLDGPIRNPYFGAEMLTCGEARSTFVGTAPRPAATGEQAPASIEPPAPSPGDDGEQRERPKATDDEQPRQQHLAKVYEHYFALRAALTADDATAAVDEAKALRAATEAGADKHLPALQALLAQLQPTPATDIAALRARFARVSAALLTLHTDVGHPGPAPLYRLHCPMALDGIGADWLQRDQTVANPYFGNSMLRCGSVTAELLPTGGQR